MSRREDAERLVSFGVEHKFSRGAYLQWLDNEIRYVEDSYGEQPCAGEALREARKAFTKEFYP